MIYKPEIEAVELDSVQRQNSLLIEIATKITSKDAEYLVKWLSIHPDYRNDMGAATLASIMTLNTGKINVGQLIEALSNEFSPQFPN